MGYETTIRGEIKGLSEDSFELIKEDLEEAFESVCWKNDTIEINSYGKHYQTEMFPIYDKIAFCIDENGSGGLEEEGNEQFDFSTIFFRHRQWRQVWVEVTFPENPFAKPKILERIQ